MQKRNECLEKIRKVAKKDDTWKKNAERRFKYRRYYRVKNYLHYKWLRLKRFLGLRK